MDGQVLASNGENLCELASRMNNVRLEVLSRQPITETEAVQHITKFLLDSPADSGSTRIPEDIRNRISILVNAAKYESNDNIPIEFSLVESASLDSSENSRKRSRTSDKL